MGGMYKHQILHVFIFTGSIYTIHYTYKALIHIVQSALNVLTGSNFAVWPGVILSSSLLHHKLNRGLDITSCLYVQHVELFVCH